MRALIRRVQSVPRNSLLRLRTVSRQVRRRRLRSRRFNEAVAANPLLSRSPDPEYLKQIGRYWHEHFGRPVNPRWHVACANVTGISDVRYVPLDVWWDDILPFFNDMSMRPAYSDKNLYRILLREYDAPAAIISRVHGHYYADGSRPAKRETVLDIIRSDGRNKIIKPSRSDNGKGISKIMVSGDSVLIDDREVAISDIEQSYGQDFTVQSLIEQHPVMAEVHPSSVNTLRLLTFRWHDAVHHLVTFARFGTGGAINDNAATGGVCCGVDDDGRLNEVAVDKYGRSYATHPTSGYPFANRNRIPNFRAIRDHVLALHEQIYHFDLVSWDIAVGPAGQAIFVECNFRGTSILCQYAARRPVFGDMTTEVLRAVRHGRRS